MHPDKFDFERFKERLIKHKVAPQGHVLLLNAVKEYDSLCRKYHEKIPLWFARYDRTKQLLVDRCPDYKFVPELEAHKIFDYSGLDSSEQFKIWERAGKKWDPEAIRSQIIQYSDDLEALDADRVQKGKYAEGVRHGKWKKRTYVARSDVHEGTDLRPEDVQQSTFSEQLDNTVPFDPFNPCYSVRAQICLLYTSPSPRDQRGSRMPSSA